jgi:XRE family transcriptional regulator, fatty acid utilization regulator
MKLRHYRMAKKFSFQELSDATGISKSYLNEMEMGLKRPKVDKLNLLTKALDLNVDELESPVLPPELMPIGKLIESNFLYELPLEMLGFNLSKLLAILADAPTQVSAFIASMLELSRNFNSRESHFYFSALRAYIEINRNYFEDLEQAVHHLNKTVHLEAEPGRDLLDLEMLLFGRHGITVVYNGLDTYQELQTLRSLFLPETKRFLLNSQLSAGQVAFQLSKELAFQELKLTPRAYTSSLLQFHTFDEVLNHFRAGYFAAALLIPETKFKESLSAWIEIPTWQPQTLTDWLDQYASSPEMLMQRMTNLLPKFFGIYEVVFMRINRNSTGKLELSKEMHLDRKRIGSLIGPEEHYCARTTAVTSLQGEGRQVSAAIETNLQTGTSFFMMTIAWGESGKRITTTLGVRLNNATKSPLAFASDITLKKVEVGVSCERCQIADCLVRQNAPVLALQKQQRDKMQEALRNILNSK